MVAAATVAVGAISAYSANQSANKQADVAKNGIKAQTELGNRQAALAEDQWGYFVDTYQPRERELLESAYSGNDFPVSNDIRIGESPLDYDNSRFGLNALDQLSYYNDPRVQYAANEAGGAVTADFAAQKENLLNSLSERGVNPSSGQYLSLNRDLGVRGAAARVAAKNRAKIGMAEKLEGQDFARNSYFNERDYQRKVGDDLRLTSNSRINDDTNYNRRLNQSNIDWGRRFDATSLGRGLASNATAGLASAGSTMGNATNAATNMMNTYANNANQGSQLLVNGLGMLSKGNDNPQTVPVYDINDPNR